MNDQFLFVGHLVSDERTGEVGVFNGWTISRGHRYARIKFPERLHLRIPERFVGRLTQPRTTEMKKKRARAALAKQK
jgi:hypothetical protein